MAPWRPGQESTSSPTLQQTYALLCQIQHDVWKGDEVDFKVGSWMLEPMRLWMEGASVHALTEETDISVGHACKAIQRMAELLRQMEASAAFAGDQKLGALCATAREKLVRGLPFVPSLYLRA